MRRRSRRDTEPTRDIFGRKTNQPNIQNNFTNSKLPKGWTTIEGKRVYITKLKFQNSFCDYPSCGKLIHLGQLCYIGKKQGSYKWEYFHLDCLGNNKLLPTPKPLLEEQAKPHWTDGFKSEKTEYFLPKSPPKNKVIEDCEEDDTLIYKLSEPIKQRKLKK